ncbi:hypothetical protein TWF281_005532 [Arthrobotrys megalospora]
MQPANIQTIPPEIHDSILSHLALTDIKALSLCSKSCRRKSLPSLFRNIRINIYLAERFDKDIAEIRHHVRYAYLRAHGDEHLYYHYNGGRPPKSLRDLPPTFLFFSSFIKVCIDYAFFLSHFPNLQTIKLEMMHFRCIAYLLSCAIFKALSTNASYPKTSLKKLILMQPDSLECQPDDHPNHREAVDGLTGQNKEFVKGGCLSGDELRTLFTGSFNIEEVVIIGDRDASVGGISVTTADTATEVLTMTFGETLLCCLKDSLKRLEILSPKLYFRPISSTDNDLICSGVNYLKINPSELSRWSHIGMIGLTFPNLKELVIGAREEAFYCFGEDYDEDEDYEFEDGGGLRDQGDVFNAFGSLRGLRRCFVVRPLMKFGGQASRGQLQSEVEYWINGGGGDPPLEELEYVEFCTKIPGDKSIACTIIREEREGMVTTENYAGGKGTKNRFKWQTIEQDFWDRMYDKENPDPMLQRQVGVELEFHEYHKDVYYQGAGRLGWEEALDIAKRGYESLTVVPGTEF